ncbi:KAP family P-loop NTPase fold protein [Winogradskyella flava]|uniref:KAP family P-loop NTPase fold protein n=1 Tax=Winogradskyella flava TaxID=1884876 RepID=UPI002492C947|nr:P-loop NTPase fold protein [Winogradskyella flava]
MNLRHSEIEIPKDGTDSFVNCKLDRKKYADVLTSIVSGYNSGFVLAIDNKWGTGKTTFVKMWRQQLINQKYKTLYFNAWENDFQEEVIIALLSELEEFRNKGEQTFMTLVEKSATFLKKVFPTVVKGVASKAIGDKAITEVVGAITEFTVDEVELQIKNYNEKKKGINDFRKALEEFVDNVDEDKPVVFIIDELDRCRPRYAVEVLEQIKHLFSVPGIVFVLSIDKVQLGNAVRGFYGSDLIDADEYLRRFIDLEYKIPKPNTQLFISHLYDYFAFDDFIKSPTRTNSSEFSHDKDGFKTISNVLYSKGFSLRQIEKAFVRIRLTLRFFDFRQFVFPEVIILLSYLHINHPDILNKIRNYKYSLQELVNELDKILFTLSDNTNIRTVRFLLASFLCRYLNGYVSIYKQSTIGLIDRHDPNHLKLRITSKLEDDSESLLKAVEYYKNHRFTDDVELDFILSKFDLTENLKN